MVFQLSVGGHSETKEKIRRLLNWRKKFGDMTSTEVPMRESNFLQLERNFPHFEQTEDAGPSTVNIEEAFRVLTQCVHRIEHKMDSFNVRMEMVEKTLEELRSKSPVGAPSKQPSYPCPPSPSLKIVEPTCLVRKTEPTTDGKNKMVMDSDEDSVDRRLNLSLDKIMGWMGTREEIDEPVQLKQKPQTSTSVSVLPTRPSRNRKPGRYQLSPYDQVSRGANPKYKAGPFQVNDPVTLEKLNLIQYAFNKEADESEILNRHSLLTLLPGAYLYGKVISMKAHHLTLIQQVVEKDVPMNWYLPTRYSVSLAVLMVGDEVDCFARASRCGKNFMQQPQFPSNMQHVKFQDFPINRGIGVPKQRNGYDCGVYVINYMDNPEFIPKKSSTLV
ncbi:hypothetical protein CUMW_150310 [Citrus unshiu]|uniref:Ubiquitin-like protease family profile domain-containing protein n=1 Tax=Citrus unshiu TaxID=55188 RepID=A0A2H5PMK4_CITUN|nr:hypothetical protein CUMW_150310 [Citrus unshiu]